MSKVAEAIAKAETDKMLVAQGGPRRLRDLQQPGAPQCRVAGHVGSDGRDPRDFRNDHGHRGRRGDRRRRQGVRVRRRHLEVRERALRRGGGRRLQRRWSRRATTRSTSFPKPTIAMIRGYCIGGGLGLAICCDLRIATESSKFGVPAAKLGLGYGYPGLKRLVDVVGPVVREGDLLHRRGSSTAAEAQRDGPGQPRRAGATNWKTTSRTTPTRSPATRR